MKAEGIMRRLRRTHVPKGHLREDVQAAVPRSAKVQAPPSKKKGNETQDAYDVVLSDTVLFPEGGGQPFDLGVMEALAVLAQDK